MANPTLQGFARSLLSFKRSTPKAPSSSLTVEVAVERMMSTLMRTTDPDKVLRGIGKGREYLGSLLFDDDIYGGVSTRRDKLLSTPYRLEGGNDTMNAALLEQLRPHINAIFRTMFDGLLYGYSVLEIVYLPRGGIALAMQKPMRLFDVKRTGEAYYYPEHSAVPELCDPRKFIVTVVNSTFDNPQGDALLSRLYWPWYFRQQTWPFWMKNLERFADPLLLASVENPSDFVAKITELGIQNIVAVGPNETMNAVAKSGDGEFQRLEETVLKRYYRLILGQTLTSDSGTNGSRALGDVHDGVRSDKRNADIKMCLPGMQRIIDTLCELNFPGQTPPVFEMSDNIGIEQERADRDATLVNAGIVKLTEAYLMDRYDFNAGDIVVPDPTAPPPPQLQKTVAVDNKGKPLPGVKASATKTKFTPQQMAVERVADGVLASYDSPISADTMRAVINAATSPQDLADRFAVLFAELDHEAYAQGLERALFVGDVLGYAHASQ